MSNLKLINTETGVVVVIDNSIIFAAVSDNVDGAVENGADRGEFLSLCESVRIATEMDGESYDAVMDFRDSLPKSYKKAWDAK